jgi:hypothetical protein
MPSKARGGKSLKGYEGANLLFFFLVILVLGGFVAIVFQFYRGADRPAAAERPGVLSEAEIPGTEACMFYLGTRISQNNRRYIGLHDVPATDDGLVRDLFAIPGVAEVVVDRSMVMLHKAPSAKWETIKPDAHEVINRHLHMHQ